MADPNYPVQDPAFARDPVLRDPAYRDAAATGETPAVRDMTLSEFQLTPEETAEADLLYEELKPLATAECRNYVLARTPASMQEYMATKIDADWPLPAGDDPGTTVRVQGEQGRVSVQKPAISDKSPQVAFAGKLLDPIRNQLDTGRDANARRISP